MLVLYYTLKDFVTYVTCVFKPVGCKQIIIRFSANYQPMLLTNDSSKLCGFHFTIKITRQLFETTLDV